ncbi:MAG: serine/threonine protein kinase [Planctomycetales bacterium]
MTKAISYQAALHHSRLIPEDQLGTILAELEAEVGREQLNAAHLAKRILRDKLITPWQHSMLAAGRYQNFYYGKYKLLRYLTSGVSTIFLAIHEGMNRKVAVKILPVDRNTDASHLERFVRECQFLASMDHPNIIRAHDIDVEKDNQYYMILDFVDGLDLEKFVADRGPLPCKTAVNYARQTAEGLAHAHEHGLVHRDVKPANLMLDKEGVVKILDLGMARVTQEQAAEEQEDAASVTLLRGEILGTADYVAPEQVLDSHHVDNRADVYSLGCTLYYFLTGRPPYADCASMAQKLLAHHRESPPRIKEQREDVPPELEAIVYRMMAKDVEQRCQSMIDVIAELDQALAAAN